MKTHGRMNNEHVNFMTTAVVVVVVVMMMMMLMMMMVIIIIIIQSIVTGRSAVESKSNRSCNHRLSDAPVLIEHVYSPQL